MGNETGRLGRFYLSSGSRLLMFIRIIASKINTIPDHCKPLTCSLIRANAIKTETGISSDARIAPKPIPVSGIPRVSRIGGRIVPKMESKIPQRRKILRE